jgi:hypothetical protein
MHLIKRIAVSIALFALALGQFTQYEYVPSTTCSGAASAIVTYATGECLKAGPTTYVKYTCSGTDASGMTCTDSACTIGCQTQSAGTPGTCTPSSSGSQKITCASPDLSGGSYFSGADYSTSDCSGTPLDKAYVINACISTSAGSSQAFCNSTSFTLAHYTSTTCSGTPVNTLSYPIGCAAEGSSGLYSSFSCSSATGIVISWIALISLILLA